LIEEASRREDELAARAGLDLSGPPMKYCQPRITSSESPIARNMFFWSLIMCS
jgi:hypothetical protein